MGTQDLTETPENADEPSKTPAPSYSDTAPAPGTPDIKQIETGFIAALPIDDGIEVHSVPDITTLAKQGLIQFHGFFVNKEEAIFVDGSGNAPKVEHGVRVSAWYPVQSKKNADLQKNGKSAPESAEGHTHPWDICHDKIQKMREQYEACETPEEKRHFCEERGIEDAAHLYTRVNDRFFMLHYPELLNNWRFDALRNSDNKKVRQVFQNGQFGCPGPETKDFIAAFGGFDNLIRALYESAQELKDNYPDTYGHLTLEDMTRHDTVTMMTIAPLEPKGSPLPAEGITYTAVDEGGIFRIPEQAGPDLDDYDFVYVPTKKDYYSVREVRTSDDPDLRHHFEHEMGYARCLHALYSAMGFKKLDEPIITENGDKPGANILFIGDHRDKPQSDKYSFSTPPNHKNHILFADEAPYRYDGIVFGPWDDSAPPAALQFHGEGTDPLFHLLKIEQQLQALFHFCAWQAMQNPSGFVAKGDPMVMHRSFAEKIKPLWNHLCNCGMAPANELLIYDTDEDLHQILSKGWDPEAQPKPEFSPIDLKAYDTAFGDILKEYCGGIDIKNFCFAESYGSAFSSLLCTHSQAEQIAKLTTEFGVPKSNGGGGESVMGQDIRGFISGCETPSETPRIMICQRDHLFSEIEGDIHDLIISGGFKLEEQKKDGFQVYTKNQDVIIVHTQPYPMMRQYLMAKYGIAAEYFVGGIGMTVEFLIEAGHNIRHAINTLLHNAVPGGTQPKDLGLFPGSATNAFKHAIHIFNSIMPSDQHFFDPFFKFLGELFQGTGLDYHQVLKIKKHRETTPNDQQAIQAMAYQVAHDFRNAKAALTGETRQGGGIRERDVTTQGKNPTVKLH